MPPQGLAAVGISFALGHFGKNVQHVNQDSWGPTGIHMMHVAVGIIILGAYGVVGPNTLAMLNASSQDKARRIAVNLERLRWLQRSPPTTRIDVNTAASTLSYLEEGKIVWTAAVVPGRPGHETPQLQAAFEQIVVILPGMFPLPSRPER